MVKETGTKEKPWKLKTPPGTSEYEMFKDINKDGSEIMVCTVGKTVLHYDARCIKDLYSLLTGHGDWMELGGADEQKPAKEGTVEAWGRSETNPCWRVVWIKERIAWPLWCIYTSIVGSHGFGGTYP